MAWLSEPLGLELLFWVVGMPSLVRINISNVVLEKHRSSMSSPEGTTVPGAHERVGLSKAPVITSFRGSLSLDQRPRLL